MMPASVPLDADAALRAHLARVLDTFEVHDHPVDDRHHAAVALAVVEGGHGADLEGLPRHDAWQREGALLLTRRAETLRRHAGQWALPGGRLDPGETPEVAALRELEEETGLALAADAVLGRLDDFTTRSGFVMTPVVVWGGPARKLVPNPGEVASVHRVPFAELLRPDAPLLEHEAVDDEHPAPLQPALRHPVLRMPVGAGSIAAPTAALLYQFREVLLLGRVTRVAHFEQPRFAWR